jgi:hypothetical protein
LKLCNFSDLNDETPISQIKQKIQEITAINLNEIEIRFGFPPKLLTASDDSTLISSGIKSGGKTIAYRFSLDPISLICIVNL